MINDKPRKTELLTPLREGEFRRINGIGETTEAHLHAAGILTFDQLAFLSPEEIAAALPGQVSVKERVSKQDWTGQARQFAQALLEAEKPQEPADAGDRQHYESFLVELLMDEEHHVRRTRVTCVRGGEKTGWTGWEPTRLDQWIAAQAGLVEAVLSADEENKDQPEASSTGHRTRQPKPPRATGSLTLGNMTLHEIPTGRERQLFPSFGRFEAHVLLDLLGVETPDGVQLAYFVTIAGHRLGEGRHVTFGEARGECLPGAQLDLCIPVNGLEEGTYRMEIAAHVYPVGAEQPERMGLSAFAEGKLVHLYARELEPA